MKCQSVFMGSSKTFVKIVHHRGSYDYLTHFQINYGEIRDFRLKLNFGNIIISERYSSTMLPKSVTKIIPQQVL